MRLLSSSVFEIESIVFMCETVPDFSKEAWKNRFAWVIHDNVIEIPICESLKSPRFVLFGF